MSFIGNNPSVVKLKYRPQSSDPSNPAEGEVFYSDGTSRLEGLWVFKNGSWEQVGAGSASGINYILNSDAESDTSGWLTYKETRSVTFQDTGDTVTFNNHGLTNGTAISFTSIVDTTGISVDTTYYVISATTNTFQVSATPGGSALSLTTDGSGTMVSSKPLAGTGGSPTITWVRSTTTPLRGQADFNLVKDAANRMGEGVAYAFTIDSADKNKPLNISFDYEKVSGTYPDDAITVWILDVTNSIVIQPSGNTIQNVLGPSSKKNISFQTSSSLSYRLMLHVSGADTGAYTLAFDNAKAGPDHLSTGAPITDAEPYTPTYSASFGTVTSISVKKTRIGDRLFVEGTTNSGTTSSGLYSISLPPGHSIDTTKISIGNTTSDSGQIVGKWASSGTSGSTGNVVTATGTSATLVYFSGGVGGTVTGTPFNGSGLITNSDTFAFWFSVPIQGWSSNVQMSNDADTRVVAASYQAAGTTATGTNISFATKFVDTHNAWNTNIFTCPVPGIYECSANILLALTAGASFDFQLFKNGSLYTQIAGFDNGPAGGTSSTASGKIVLPLIAGDTVSFRWSGGSGMVAFTGSDYGSMNIVKLSGPSQIAAAETISMSANSTANTSIPANTDVIVPFSTVLHDTHGGLNVSTGEYTIQAAGKYAISAQITWAGTGSTGTAEARIFKNGAMVATSLSFSHSTSTHQPSVNVRRTLNLVTGDVVTIIARRSANSNGLSTTANETYVSIDRIGNF